MSSQIENKFEKFDVIDDFEILKIIGDEIKRSIKILYIFRNRSTIFPYEFKEENCIYVTETGEVHAFGENSLGCLGFTTNRPIKFGPEDTLIRNSKSQFHLFNNGSYHVIARNRGGEVYSWGYNNLGQLGNNMIEYKSCGPQKIEVWNDKFIIDVCCGDFHSLALSNNGKIYAWGDNKFGQCGNPSYKKCVPEPDALFIPDECKIIAISCGSFHSMALTKNHTVYSWGLNKFGQLGIGTFENSHELVKIKVPGGKLIRKISCGQKSSILLSEDGFIYIFGKCYFAGTDKYQKEPFQIVGLEFQDIISNISLTFTIALSKGNYCQEIGKVGIKKMEELSRTDFDNFLDYYVKNCKITPGAINIEDHKRKTSSRILERQISQKTERSQLSIRNTRNTTQHINDNPQLLTHDNRTEIDESNQQVKFQDKLEEESNLQGSNLQKLSEVNADSNYQHITINAENNEESYEAKNTYVKIISSENYQLRRAQNKTNHYNENITEERQEINEEVSNLQSSILQEHSEVNAENNEESHEASITYLKIVSSENYQLRRAQNKINHHNENITEELQEINEEASNWQSSILQELSEVNPDTNYQHVTINAENNEESYEASNTYVKIISSETFQLRRAQNKINHHNENITEELEDSHSGNKFLLNTLDHIPNLRLDEGYQKNTQTVSHKLKSIIFENNELDETYV